MGENINPRTGFERVDRARSVNNLRVVLRDIIAEFDVQHAAYFGIPPLEEMNTQAWIVLATYPEAWMRHYMNEDYVRIDPAMLAARSTFVPVDWRDLHTDDPRAARFCEEAREFGIAGHGLSFPIRGPGGDFAVFTVTADVSETAWRALKDRRLADWMALGHAIHQRVLDTNAIAMGGGLRRLSPREREILQLTAHGLTSDEVAARFGISERVVRGYLQACRNKLNAQNSTHAVARAVKLGLVAVN